MRLQKLRTAEVKNIRTAVFHLCNLTFDLCPYFPITSLAIVANCMFDVPS